MGQDIVKAIKVNGKLVQTGRDVLPWHDVVRLAGFGLGARVTVTAKHLDDALGVQELQRGEYVTVRPGLDLSVKVAPRV